jgi:Flp pilus assembly protein TadG
MLSRPLRDDRGSSLMLMPAAVLVFVVLGAFCVDFGAIHLGQRELVTAAQGAANDAAAAGFDEGAFYSGDGTVTLDPALARRAATASLADNAPDARIVGFSVDVATSTVEIELTLAVETVFSKALPGAPDTVEVTARATSDLEQ